MISKISAPVSRAILLANNLVEPERDQKIMLLLAFLVNFLTG
ncbi:hypothetical protein ACERHZ_02725 [Lactobacillus acidophilus]